jgi:hypothetical protein
MNDASIASVPHAHPDEPESRITQPPHSDYPDIPYPIIRPARGSPYYIHPRSGRKAHLFAPGSPPLTSEDVRRELEDFP